MLIEPKYIRQMSTEHILHKANVDLPPKLHSRRYSIPSSASLVLTTAQADMFATDRNPNEVHLVLPQTRIVITWSDNGFCGKYF
jgi:hypothetical protein